MIEAPGEAEALVEVLLGRLVLRSDGGGEGAEVIAEPAHRWVPVTLGMSDMCWRWRRVILRQRRPPRSSPYHHPQSRGDGGMSCFASFVSSLRTVRSVLYSGFASLGERGGRDPRPPMDARWENLERTPM